MHDIWNPWHGCVKCSEGCDNCYMYFLDRVRGLCGSDIFRTKKGFDYLLKKKRDGSYRVKSGELIRVCMTSDFFLEEADEWREEVWDIIWQRRDVKFFLLTKRPERAELCLPRDWGDGWPNVFFNVTCENQRRADERIPILLSLPFQHKGIMCAPLIGSLEIGEYLDTGQIEQVIAGGENYGGARPCRFEWIQSLNRQCRRRDITFAFIETGTNFVKDGKTYHMPKKSLQSEMAFRSGMNYRGRPIDFVLTDNFGLPVEEGQLYRPQYDALLCETCGSRLICNGCSGCGQCEK